jgi:hypothetical protein
MGTPPRYKPPPKPRFDYSRLIKDSLSLTWRHKFLWFFGLFAAGNTTYGGWSGNFNFSTGNGTGSGHTIDQGRNEVGDWISSHVGLIVAVGLALLAVGILVWLWSIICRGAVIGSVQDIREDKPSGFGSAFRRGRRSFGRLLLFDLLLLAIFMGIGVIVTALMLLIVFMALALGEAGRIIAISIAGLVVLWLIGILIMTFGYLSCITFGIALVVPLTLIIVYATRAIVLDGERPISALRLGWRLMFETLSRSLLLFLMGAGLGIVANIGTLVAVGVAAVPAIIAWIVTGTGGWAVSGIVLSSILSLLPLLVLILVVAVTNTYFTSFWTIIYLKLTGREPEAPAAPFDPALAPYPPAPAPG